MSLIEELKEKVEQIRKNYELAQEENRELMQRLKEIAGDSEAKEQIVSLQEEIQQLKNKLIQKETEILEKDTEIEAIIAKVETLLG